MNIRRESFRPEEIVVPHRLRDIVPEAVDALMESIKVIGLQTPLTVRWDKDEEGDDAVILVAGRHRLEACTRLGMQMIECAVFEGSEKDARRWEISENLHRADLTALQHDEHVAEWIRLTADEGISYQNDKKFPENEKRGRGRPEGGIAAAARQLPGVNYLSATRAVQVASLTDEAKRTAQAVGLDDNRSVLLAAAREKTADAQVIKIRQEAERRASKAVPPPRDPYNDIEVIDKQVDRLIAAWNAASKEAREEFLRRVDTSIVDRRYGQ